MSVLDKVKDQLDELTKGEERVEKGEKPEGLTNRVIRYPGGVIKEKIYQRNDGGTGITNPFVGVLFLVWFIGSIIGMIELFGAEGCVGYGAAMFGQLFLGFGIVALLSGVKMGVLFSSIGACVASSGLMYQLGSNETREFLLNKFIPAAICGVFIVVGVMFLCQVYSEHILKRKRCTLPAIAVCSYVTQEILHVSRGSGANQTSPVLMWVSYFRYYHNGVYYYADCEAVPISKSEPELGVSRDVKINPESPAEYYQKRKWDADLLVNTLLGITFTVVGVVVLSLVITIF